MSFIDQDGHDLLADLRHNPELCQFIEEHLTEHFADPACVGQLAEACFKALDIRAVRAEFDMDIAEILAIDVSTTPPTIQWRNA